MRNGRCAWGTVGQRRGASSGRTHERGDAFAKQGDGLHEFCVWERGDVHLETEPRDAAESGAVFEDFLRDFIGAADEERAMAADERVEMSARDGRPAALFADLGESVGVTGKNSSAACSVESAT